MRKAISLIELIAAIVVFAIAVPTLFLFFSDIVRSSHTGEVIATASRVAGNVLEEISSKRFDENIPDPDDPGGTTYTDLLLTDPDDLGIDGNNGLNGTSAENSTDHYNWDDIDDYDGWSAAYDDDPSYEIEVEVFYVDGDNDPPDFETPVAAAGTHYKRVVVRVSHVPDITVETGMVKTPLVIFENP